jgi:hypothetical protein
MQKQMCMFCIPKTLAKVLQFIKNELLAIVKWVHLWMKLEMERILL